MNFGGHSSAMTPCGNCFMEAVNVEASSAAELGRRAERGVSSRRTMDGQGRRVCPHERAPDTWQVHGEHWLGGGPAERRSLSKGWGVRGLETQPRLARVVGAGIHVARARPVTLPCWQLPSPLPGHIQASMAVSGQEEEAFPGPEPIMLQFQHSDAVSALSTAGMSRRRPRLTPRLC